MYEQKNRNQEAEGSSLKFPLQKTKKNAKLSSQLDGKSVLHERGYFYPLVVPSFFFFFLGLFLHY